MQETDESWIEKSFVIERFADWKAMIAEVTEHYGSTHIRADTYIHSISPHTNTINGNTNRRLGNRLVAGRPVIEEVRQCVDKTLVSIEAVPPGGEYIEFKMEKGPDGKLAKVIENGRPIVIDKYYKFKESRVHYLVTLGEIKYDPWSSWGPIGSIRTVRLGISIERIDGVPNN
jgi:hypothetical protein